MADIHEFWKLEGSLDTIDWDPDNREAVPEAAQLLQDVGLERLRELAKIAARHTIMVENPRKKAAFRSPLAPIDQKNRDQLIFEKPTHTKLYLGGTRHTNTLYHDNPYGYKLWLHVWRDDPTGRYADLDHNHRYELAGMPIGDMSYWMTLRRCTDLALQQSDIWEPTPEEWKNPEVDRLIMPGEAWSMNALDVHSIRYDQYRAPISFVVQGPRQRTESCIYDEQTGKVKGLFPDYHDTEVEYVYSELDKHKPYLVI